MTVTATRWVVEVTCPACGGELADRAHPDPSDAVRRRTLTCVPCDRSWHLTVTLCPERGR